MYTSSTCMFGTSGEHDVTALPGPLTRRGHAAEPPPETSGLAGAITSEWRRSNPNRKHLKQAFQRGRNTHLGLGCPFSCTGRWWWRRWRQCGSRAAAAEAREAAGRTDRRRRTQGPTFSLHCDQGTPMHRELNGTISCSLCATSVHGRWRESAAEAVCVLTGDKC